jgi:hypothetical protein
MRHSRKAIDHKGRQMFRFRKPKGSVAKRDSLDEILARHKANLVAERRAPARTDLPPMVLAKKPGFGKRSINA